MACLVVVGVVVGVVVDEDSHLLRQTIKRMLAYIGRYHQVVFASNMRHAD